MAQQHLSPEQFEDINAYYLERPTEFMTDVLGCNLWQTQKDIVDMIFKYSNVAVKTCNSIGKTYIAARVAVAYLMLHPNSIVVTTAPTWNQVVNALWREIRTTISQAKYQLTDAEVSQAGLNIDTKWYAIGISTRNADNMMGFHTDHLLVVVDEAGGVEDIIYQGVDAITTNINNKILLIGNPTTPGGVFWNAFEPGSNYRQITVSAFDTPNLLANGFDTIEKVVEYFTPAEGMDVVDDYEMKKKAMKLPFPELIHAGTVYERFKNWGIDSPAWQALTLGQFPSQSDQALIPTDLVSKAMNMYGTDSDTGLTFAELSGWEIPDGPPSYGHDAARFGADSNVLTPRRGGWVSKQIVWSKVDLLTSGDRILDVMGDSVMDVNVRFNIDDTGNGGGTTDYLRRKSQESKEGGNPAHQYSMGAYNFGSKDMMSDADREKFFDVTSKLYWDLRTQFYNKQIALHYDKQLFDELVSRRWSIVGKKIKVESKEDYKKRTAGKSPDRSDSLALAFADGVRHSYDPVEQSIKRDAYQPASQRPLTGNLSKTRF